MSLKASVEGLKKAKEKFKTKGKSQEYFAGSVGCTRQVIGKFLQGKAITAQFFQDICDELDLTWEEIADLEVDLPQTVHDAEIDALVQDVRSKVSSSIQKRCGTMRVLDMSQPITIDSIYISVNILEKISRNQRRSIKELLEECEVENFDRFILGPVGQKRIHALEAVNCHDKLMILGKPGAGKTTFLKWLALQCNEGKFNQNRVPLFVTLKEFAEAEGQPDLLSFIIKQLTECGVENGQEVVASILQAGRSIILLDGLDELKAQDHDRIINTIRHTTQQYDSNQFVMTCRIAAKEYVFEKFTEVEVADFDDGQIADFSYKWFQSKDPVKVIQFPQELKANPGLTELATNPLLLTLLCLVFEEGGRFPVNRSELYKEGLDVLLKKWDAKRNIKRQEVYKQISLQRKEDLLSQVAYKAFQQNDYFFKQIFVEEQIRDYIRNLPNASTETETLQLDSEAVLNSIAAQHGLLVERARGIYSFSHLTFQEYFTARWFKEKADGDFGELISHINDKQWREVFLLTVGMLKNADKLLQDMKWRIDCLLTQDEELQQFLDWMKKKSCSIKNHHKSTAIRTYYFNRARHHSRSRSLANDLANDLNLDFFTASSNLPLILELDLTLSCSLAHDLVHAVDCADAIDLNHAITNHLTFALTFACDRVHDLAIARAIARDLEIEFTDSQESLQQLKAQLPDLSSGNYNNFENWWKANGREWTEQLRAIMIENRNIGCDWQFNENQKKLLHQLYDGNKLLVDCLNSDCYVSREVREEIESTMLLTYIH
jgi:predicted NACHT family NTPase